MAQDVSLSPKSVLTCWGTWLNAFVQYCEHFELIKEMFDELGEEDAVAVPKAQHLFYTVNLKYNLIY